MKPLLLDQLELAASLHDPSAIRQLIDILAEIDRTYGRVASIPGSSSRLSLGREAWLERFAARLAGVMSTLMLDPKWSLTDELYAQLIAHHRWVNLIFSVTSYGSSEHVIAPLLHSPHFEHKERLRRLLAIYPTNAFGSEDFENFLRIDESLTLTAALHCIGTRYCFSRGEYALRETLLEWLPGRLTGIQLTHIQPQMLVEPYMLCSYATTQRKHDIKADIVELMRRACLEGGCREWDGTAPPERDKPVIFVSTEAFGPGHSVFRTHSRSVTALRQKFHVVGICFQSSLSDQTRACFDEITLYPPGDFIASIRTLSDQILLARPDMLLQLGVGMAPHTIALASLRLFPIQVASFAHTATSNSRFVDRMILPSDFVSDPATFVEPLIMVPPSAMPYSLRPDGEKPSADARARPSKRSDGQPVKIGLPAAIMKLNPRVFDTLRRISEGASRPIEIHLFPLGSVGIAHLALIKAIDMPNVVAHEEMSYATYLRQLGECDFFLCPFPYGNVNSVVDCVRLGLPGVCWDDIQPHAHADSSLFRRAGLPEALIAPRLDDYVATAIRLIDDDDFWSSCRAAALSADLLARDFNGNPQPFVDALFDLL